MRSVYLAQCGRDSIAVIKLSPGIRCLCNVPVRSGQGIGAKVGLCTEYHILVESGGVYQRRLDLYTAYGVDIRYRSVQIESIVAGKLQLANRPGQIRKTSNKAELDIVACTVYIISEAVGIVVYKLDVAAGCV